MPRVLVRTVAMVMALSAVSAGCRDSGTSAGGARAPDGWRVERVPDVTLAVPPDWTRTDPVPSAADLADRRLTFRSVEQVEGNHRRVVISGTEGVPEEHFPDIVGTFRNVNGSRTFGAERPVDVEGSDRAVLLESTQVVRGSAAAEGRTLLLRSWNVFVHTKDTMLNVELIAPDAIFDPALFDQVLRTLSVGG